VKRLITAFAVIVALACMASSAKAGNPFDYCLLCHGSNANGNYGIRAPKLSGVEPWYLARQLENFAAGVRGMPAEDVAGHEMAPVALRLKQEGTLDDAVKFIASLASGRPHATVKGDAVQGKKVYET
jgi:cytochrome c553